MKYHFRLWCPDCMADNDKYGCFGGGVEDDEEEFDTPQEANEAGWKTIDDTIWEFEVVDENGAVIDIKEEI